jgi:hypothetical protein
VPTEAAARSFARKRARANRLEAFDRTDLRHWVHGVEIGRQRSLNWNRWLDHAFPIMRYRVHAVDIYGISHAAYELDCATDEEAQHLAASYLPRHPSSRYGRAFVVWRVPDEMTRRPPIGRPQWMVV